jgi:hypothetical protein
LGKAKALELEAIANEVLTIEQSLKASSSSPIDWGRKRANCKGG